MRSAAGDAGDGGILGRGVDAGNLGGDWSIEFG